MVVAVCGCVWCWWLQRMIVDEGGMAVAVAVAMVAVVVVNE